LNRDSLKVEIVGQVKVLKTTQRSFGNLALKVSVQIVVKAVRMTHKHASPHRVQSKVVWTRSGRSVTVNLSASNGTNRLKLAKPILVIGYNW